MGSSSEGRQHAPLRACSCTGTGNTVETCRSPVGQQEGAGRWCWSTPLPPPPSWRLITAQAQAATGPLPHARASLGCARAGWAARGTAPACGRPSRRPAARPGRAPCPAAAPPPPCLQGGLRRMHSRRVRVSGARRCAEGGGRAAAQGPARGSGSSSGLAGGRRQPAHITSWPLTVGRQHRRHQPRVLQICSHASRLRPVESSRQRPASTSKSMREPAPRSTLRRRAPSRPHIYNLLPQLQSIQHA